MTSAPSVQPEKIFKDLRKLWADLGKTEEHGVLRACAMTLIAVVSDQDDPQKLGETLAALVHEHPSRTIVVRVSKNAAPLDVRVFAQCWMPFGKRQQICCEQIEFTGSEDMLTEAAAVIRALTVPDLPVVLYCPAQHLLKCSEFGAILALATKLIVDSSRCETSTAMLAWLDSIPQRTLQRADLSWSRLTPWREAVAQIFDSPAAAAALGSIKEIRILYAGCDEPVSVFYLAGWFLNKLGGEPRLKHARGVGPAYGEIARISLHGDNFEASVELMADSSIEIVVNGNRQNLVFPAPSEYASLREELGVSGRDDLFEDVLSLAAMLRGISA